MLKFFNYYTVDEKADKMVKEFVNEQIINRIERGKVLIDERDGFVVLDEFLDFIEGWFPESGLISDELKPSIVFTLYEKLACEEEMELTAIEKFVVCRILEEIHETEVDMFMRGLPVDPFPNLDYLYDVIKAEGIAEEAECKPEDIALIWRNLSNACNFIFEDTDFLFLDMITADMIEDIAAII